MLGDAHGVGDVGSVGGGVEPGRVDNQLLVHAADFRHPLGGVGLDALPEGLDPLGMLPDVFPVLQPLFKDHMEHTVAQGHGGAGVDLQIDVGDVRQGDALGVGDNKLLTHALGLADLHPHDGVGVGGVGAGDEDHVRLQHIADPVGHGAAAQGGGQARHRGAVAEPGTVIHIVGTHGGPHKLLEEIVILIGGTGAGEARHGVGTELGFHLPDLPADEVQSLLPGGGLEHAVFADQGGGQPVLVVDEVKGELALDAEQPLVGRPLGGLGIHHPAVLHPEIDLAAHAAVGAGGADNLRLPAAEIILGFGHQRPHRTGGDAVAAGDTAGFGHGFAAIGHDVHQVAPLFHFQSVDAHQIPAGADALAAADALIHVLQIESVTQILFPVLIGQGEVRPRDAVHLAVFLQSAVAQLPAVDAVHGMDGELALQHADPGLLHRGALRPDLHAVFHRGAAGGHQIVLPLHLAGADPALGLLLAAVAQPLRQSLVVVMAEGGDENSQLFRGLQNGGPLRNLHTAVVNLECYHSVSLPF